ncbi:MAG: preprotein translocase subunit SecG [Cyclobacteriaceae bacterium]|nr:preprotein translocase subunit SecG [Cytophagales bacterium]MBX2898891.1 preprotein translocase subunit SecG [Cyclobacteriaceae bacterium]
MYYSLLIGLAIFCSVLLVLVVLAQNSKGGGLSNQFGGSGASNLIGVKKTGDFLERTTWGLAIAIMAIALTTNFTTPNSGTQNEILEKARQQGGGVNLNQTEQPIQPPADPQ